MKLQCPDCQAKYEVISDRYEVEEAPPPEPGFEFRFFVDKNDLDERRRASDAFFDAKEAYEKLVRVLANDAEAQLGGLPAKERHPVIVRMFGFPNAESAKAFVARRRPRATVADAIKRANALNSLAIYLHRDLELNKAFAVMQQAEATEERLGKPVVRACSKLKSLSGSTRLD